MGRKGSEWARWDLHVHSPASHVQNYGGQSAWEDFLEDLAALPPEFKAIGINDYLTVDGYERVRDEIDSGRLPNLELVLPVVEFRVTRFAGHRSWQRVNYHVIFSNDLEPETIRTEFLSRLNASYEIAEGEQWSGPPLVGRLEELGRLVKANAPNPSGLGSDLRAGIDNFNVEPGRVADVLGESTALAGRYLTALGKAEWDQLQWGGGSIAEKRTIITRADFVFTACTTPGDFVRSKEALIANGVHDRLLHCSDAHAFSYSEHEDRIGNSFGWIKGDRIFDGLILARHEHKDRTFAGSRPPQLEALAQRPTRYLTKIRFSRVNPDVDPWFDGVDLPLNAGLVAIIGNKGSGKSALTDAVALVAGARVESHFSFLTEERFRNPRTNLASAFECEVEWASGDADQKRLDSPVDTAEPERVRYLPQHYFEYLCSDVSPAARKDFEDEIKRVVFSWLSPDERLEAASLDDLVDGLTTEWRERLRLRRSDLTELNRQVASLERWLEPQAIQNLRNQLTERKRELAAHDGSKPQPQSHGDQEADVVPEEPSEVDDLKSKIEDLAQRQLTARERAGASRRTLQAANDLATKLDNLELYFSQHFGTEETQAALQVTGLTLEAIVDLTITREGVNHVVSEAAERIQEENDHIAELETAIESAREKQRELIENLDREERLNQETAEAGEQWTRRRQELVGDPGTEGSLEHLEAELGSIPDKTSRLRGLEEQRLTIVRELLTDLSTVRDSYRSLFTPVQEYLESEPLLTSDVSLRVDAQIRVEGLIERFLGHIDQTRRGSFYHSGEAPLDQLVARTDFADPDSATTFVEEALALLRPLDDHGRPQDPIEQQLRSGQTREGLYDLLFGLEYLTPRYTLRLNDKEVSQLSPGERGAALLVFYLLVDRERLPILLDQPEANLDNETVTRLLVPAIRSARANRQVIIVTHNPNLAVYCDADQIILAQLTRSPETTISYDSGPIEARATRQWLLDVLEGTGPAFAQRHVTYTIGPNADLVPQAASRGGVT